MTATVPAYLKLLASHHPSAELWEAETTVTARDLYPGPVVDFLGNSPKMRWTAIGEYEGTPADIYIGPSRGGYTDSAGRYIWTANPASGPFYGWDPLTHVAHVGPIDVYGGAAKRNARLSVTERGDGGLACIASQDPSDSGTGIRLYTRERESAWASVGDVTGDFTDHPIEDYPAGWGACPVMARGEDGSIYLAVQVHTPTTADYETNVDIYRAPVDADWTVNPFQPFMRGALSKTCNTLDTTGMAFCVGGGQMLCYVETTYARHQYGGIVGGTLQPVDGAIAGDAVTCKYLAGRFVVAYVNATPKLCIRRVGSALDAISGSSEIIVGDCAATTRPALWDDDDGVMYVSGRDGDSVTIYESVDGGVSWALCATSVVTSFAESVGSTTPDQALDAVRWRGGACLVTSAKCEISSSGYGNSSLSIDLGGWTSWALPATYQYNSAGTREPRANPVALWACMSDPSTQGSLLISDTGPGSVVASFTTSLRVNVTTTGAHRWTIAPADLFAMTHSRIAILRYAAEPKTGDLNSALITDSFGLNIVHGAASIEVFDASTSASLGSEAVSGIYEVYALVNQLTGDYSVYGRPFVDSDLDARAMVEIFSGTLSSGTLTPAISTTVGAVGSLGRSADFAVWGVYYAPPGTDIAPQAPYGRPISASGTWTTNGISFAGDRGAADRNQVWICRPASMYGLDKVALTESYPSLREHFRSADLGTPGTASTTAYIAFKVADADADYLAPIVACFVWTNAQNVKLQARVGSSWLSVGTAKTDVSGSGTGAANTIHAVVTTAGTSFHVGKDELMGGWVQVGTEVYTIAGNSPGLILSLGEAGTQIVIRTTEPIATPFTAADIKIVSLSCASAFGPSVAITGDGFKAAKGFRFELSGAIPPEGYWTVKAAVGFADVLGLSHGLNTLRTSTPNVVTNITRSGIMRRERTGPPLRTIEFSWQDITDPETPQTRGVLTATPDRIDDGVGNTLAIAGSTYGIVRAYVEDHGSTGRPVMYFPSYNVAAASALSAYGYDVNVVGVLSPDTWITEHAAGREEQHTDHLRGGTLKIIEVS